MAEVYVGGPVVRPGDVTPSWSTGIYAAVQNAAATLGAPVLLPESAPRLESMEPADFYREIQSRIAQSAVGIMLFAGPDTSAAVEATMLAHARKPQLIVAQTAAEVPRLLRGLPYLVRVVAVDQGSNVPDAIRDFLETNLSVQGAAIAG